MLIGLHGQKRVGKDTVCGFLLEWYEQLGYGVERRSFASSLKLSAARAIGLQFETAEEAEEWAELFKLHGEIRHGALGHTPSVVISGREYLQNYGTQAHRDIFGTDFWVDMCLPPHSSELPDDTIVVVTDVRFPNEAQRIRDLGGEVWHILRPELEQEGDTHASEVPLPSDLVDYVIVNDRSLEDLRDQAIGLVK